MDDVELNSFVSMPLSTLSTTNDYINTIDSDFSFQLVEMTLFKFPYSDESKLAWLRSFKNFISVTLSCEISLSPKRAIDDYKLGSLYGQCNNPLRTSSNKKRRSTGNEDISKLTMTNTIKISSRESNGSKIDSLSVLMICILFGLFTL